MRRLVFLPVTVIALLLISRANCGSQGVWVPSDGQPAWSSDMAPPDLGYAMLSEPGDKLIGGDVCLTVPPSYNGPNNAAAIFEHPTPYPSPTRTDIAPEYYVYRAQIISSWHPGLALEYRYDEDDIVGTEQELRLVRYDIKTDTWLDTNAVVDTVNNRLVLTPHLDGLLGIAYNHGPVYKRMSMGTAGAVAGAAILCLALIFVAYRRLRKSTLVALVLLAASWSVGAQAPMVTPPSGAPLVAGDGTPIPHVWVQGVTATNLPGTVYCLYCWVYYPRPNLTDYSTYESWLGAAFTQYLRKDQIDGSAYEDEDEYGPQDPFEPPAPGGSPGGTASYNCFSYTELGCAPNPIPARFSRDADKWARCTYDLCYRIFFSGSGGYTVPGGAQVGDVVYYESSSQSQHCATVTGVSNGDITKLKSKFGQNPVHPSHGPDQVDSRYGAPARLYRNLP